MLNKVVFHLARVLNHDLDLATLRFNFRGVGKSEGEYDHGRGEAADVVAAWSEARRRVPDKPLIGAGFSFGAGMTVLAAASLDPLGDGLPRALALLGLPLRMFTLPRPFPAAVPVAAAHGEMDEFTPPEALEQYLRSWPAPPVIHVEPEADHFLEGHLVTTTGFLSRHIEEWL
jgi:alpha/beta superfamily hydrolase